MPRVQPGAVAAAALRTGRRLPARELRPALAGLVVVGVPLLHGDLTPTSAAVGIGLAALVLGRSEQASVRRWADRVFHVLFAAYAGAALVWLTAGLLPFLVGVSPAAASTFVRWGGGVTEAVVVADGEPVPVAGERPVDPRDVAMSFEPAGLALRAASDVVVHVENRHVGVPHNLSLYEPSTGALIHRGTILDGRPSSDAPAARVPERFTAPAAGTYELRCDIHPWMRGKVTVAPGSPSGPGTWPVVGDLIRRATTAELRTVFDDVEIPSPGVVTLEYLFSLLNVGLAIFLLRLRPRDLTARLLALGMVGTGAVFNVQAHMAVAVAPWLAGIHWAGFHGVAGMTYLYAIVVFPDGRLKPAWRDLPGWRWPLRAAFLVSIFLLGTSLIGDTHGKDPFDYIAVFGLLIPVVGLTAQFGRMRHADTGTERRQSHLLVTTLVAAFAGAVTYGALVSALSAGTPAAEADQLRALVVRVMPALFGAIPVIIFVILVRFRLWDIDRIVNRAFVFGALASFIGLVYVTVVVLGSELVVGGRRGDLWLSVLATAIVAVTFQPLRERLRQLANRLVYGAHETPYDVAARFSDRVAQTYAVEQVLPRMARVVAEGTGAARAEVWIAVGGELVREASWPPAEAHGRLPLAGDRLPALDGMDGTDHAVAVTHRGRLLGVLAVATPGGESLTPTAGRLLDSLAAQAGLVLSNVRLLQELHARLEQLSRTAADLRASRQRIVTAHDAERRRIERDIHDGAQQHLVALAVKLRLARSVVTSDPRTAGPLLAELQVETQAALDTLRNLARGIYPALLADRGLGAALRSHADRLPLDVRVVDEDLRRYPAEIETAVYFCCLEALQNASKHAPDAHVTVRLHQLDGTLQFDVSDDGPGFDTGTVPLGSGLQNMTDRLAALGGTLTVTSRRGGGTAIGGSVPLPVAQAVG